MDSNKIKVNIYSFITVLLWASAFPFTKVACEHFPPNALGLIRCTEAAVFLLAAGLFAHMRKPFRKRDCLYFLLSGGMGFSVYMICFNTGILTLTSATSSVVIAATPIMTAIVATKLFNEKIKPVGWISICVAFAGVAILLFQNGTFSVNTGVIWTIAATCAFCGYNIMNRKLSALGYTSLEIVTYSMICGALLLMFFIPDAVSSVASADIQDIILVVYMGIVPSAISYLLWGKALAIADKTNDVTNYMFVTPLLSTILGFIILREVPDTGTFTGGGVIILSLIIFNIKGK